MRNIQVGSLCLLLLLPLQALRSQVGALRILERPKKYQQPYNESDLAPATDRTERMPNLAWLVWSDRDRNVSYTAAGGTQRQQILSFLEEFYVVGEQGEYIRVAKDSKADAINLRLSPQAQDCGWIHKSKMILWGKTLVTEAGKIPRKAMLLNTIAHLQTQRGDEPNVVKFRKGPGEAYGSDQESGLFQFFFVVKSEKEGNETWLLLAKTENVPQDERNRKNLIAGWAPLSRAARWDHRKAVEPNWEAEAVGERRKGRVATAFGDEPTAINYVSGRGFDKEKVLWTEGDPAQKNFGERKIGEWRRFPVMREPHQDLRTIGLMGEIYSGKGVRIASPEKIAEIQRKLDEIARSKRQVNIVFVIDGTSSMVPYFPAATAAIRQSVREVKKRFEKNVLRVGAVVYRDLNEGNDRLAERKGLDGNEEKVIEFLETRDVGEIKKGDDIPEAVYYGLRTALRQTGIQKEMSNVVILIGDAGNHGRQDASQFSTQEIESLLADRMCDFLAFQVHRKAHSAYDDFIRQPRALIQNVADRKFGEVVQEYGLGLFGPPTVKEENEHTYFLQGGAFVGGVYGLQRGDTLDARLLTAKLSETIVNLNDRAEKVVMRLNDIMNGKALTADDVQYDASNPFVSAFAPGITNHLISKGITKEDIDLLSEKKYQMFIQAVIPRKTSGQRYPIYKDVLFLSREELTTMVNQMVELAHATEEREPLQKTWIEILKNYLGKIDMNAIKEKTLQQLNEMAFGLPGTSDFLKDVKLVDITDPSRFPDRDLRRYVEGIRKKLVELRTIANAPEEKVHFMFRSNEVPYYWIAEDLIP